jgi:ribosomal-protein-alanine N-acetyltransferase
VTVALRPMGRGDLAAVLTLERALFGVEAWTEGMLSAELAAVPGGRYYLVAEDESLVVGYAGLLAVRGGQADVLTMAVAEDRWGQGIGAALLGELLAEAARRGCREVFLEVRVDNPRAQNLYRKHGFTEIGLRRGYYQPSGTDALVMRRAAPGATGPGVDRGGLMARGRRGRRRASAQNAPAQNASAQNAPAQNASAQNAPAQSAPAQNAPARNAGGTG